MLLSRSTLLVSILNTSFQEKKKAIDLVSYCKDIVFAPHITGNPTGLRHPHFAPPISKFFIVYIKKRQLRDHEVVLKDFRVHQS